MEANACVKAVVSAATQYKNNRNEDNGVCLQRQLDVLMSVTGKGLSLEFFDPKQLLYTECLACLVEIMNDPHTKAKPSLAQKTLSLLSNLANSRTVVGALHKQFNLMSVLANYLRLQLASTSDGNVFQCIRLMQKVSYGCSISGQESYTADLVRFLVKHIDGKETEMTPWCIGLLANLCRNNLTVQMYVKGQDNLKQFYKKLLSFLSHRNQKMEIFSLSVIAYLCLNDDIGDRLLNTQNINQIFQLLFNVIVNSEASVTRQYAVDLFTDLLQFESRVQQSLIKYDHLDTCLQRVLSMMSGNDVLTVNKLIELCISFCKVASLRSTLCRIIVNWSTVSGQCQLSPLVLIARCASLPTADNASAVDFIRHIYEELFEEGVKLCDVKPTWIEVIIPLIIDSFNGSVSTVTKQLLLKQLAVIKLLITLCHDEQFPLEIASKVDLCGMCATLVENQLKFVRHTSATIIETGDCTDVGLDLVICMLDLMLRLSKADSTLCKHVDALLKDSRLIPFIVHSLTSDVCERVRRALNIVIAAGRLPDFSTDNVANGVAAVSRGRLAGHCLSNNGHSLISSNGLSLTSPAHLNSEAGHSRTKALNNATLDSSVQSIINKMQNGLELRDVRASEIIDIYEHRLQSLQSKENYLQDLLDAKSLTLTQSDRLLAQYRTRIAQYEAEANKLRSLLQEWERRTEDYHEQLNEALVDRDKLQTDLDQLSQENIRLQEVAENHKQLTDAFTQQAQRLETAQRSLSAVRQENQSLLEMSDMLKRHHETLKQQHDASTKQLEQLDEERKNLSRTLNEKEVKEKDMSRTIVKFEERTKKLTSDNAELESAVDRLRTELSRAEQTKKDLQHEVTSLEVVCRQHEISLKEKEQTMLAQRTELDKHAQIAALIHSLSGGKAAPS